MVEKSRFQSGGITFPIITQLTFEEVNSSEEKLSHHDHFLIAEENEFGFSKATTPGNESEPPTFNVVFIP
jgi:hypothetical protein